jgi:hypothetical protein
MPLDVERHEPCAASGSHMAVVSIILTLRLLKRRLLFRSLTEPATGARPVE